MAQEPETSNEISGQVSGNAWQIGEVRGDLNYTQHVHHAPAQEELQLDLWVLLAAVIAVVSGLTMIYVVLVADQPFPLVGPGVVLDRAVAEPRGPLRWPSTAAGVWLGIWQVWSALDLFSPRRQPRQRDRNAAQIALWTSFIPVFVALGAPVVWIVLCLLATASALICLLRGPHSVLRGRRLIAVLVAVVACATWFVPDVVALWSDVVDVPVLWGVAGTLLLLVIIAVPVHAVLTAPAPSAARVLRSWVFCLGTKIAATVLAASNAYPVPGRAGLFAWLLPLFGVLAVLLLAAAIRERASVPGA
jgi:hypothetical protein